MKSSPIVAKAALFVIFALGGFGLSGFLYFTKHPLFGIPYFAQGIVALFCGAVSSGGVPRLLEGARWRLLELIRKTVYRALMEFWGQRAMRARRSVQEKSKKKHKAPDFGGAAPVILDTSALIDGRIAEVVKTGFLDNPLLVPQFVLDELQKIADSEDDIRRRKGRRGLEILEGLSKDKKIKLSVLDSDAPAGRDAPPERLYAKNKNIDVDKRLILFAKKVKGKIATVDFNLNKVASVSKVPVLNINELVNAVKTSVLPGEVLKVKVIQEGKESGQGVGYLEDGTMVVIENGRSLIGKQAKVKVSRIIQTAAGKMIFAVTQ
ncbi:TRAM domain-containing protein [Candidatus Parcubacteria bacterium]|nr:TRAM domain-containing protein [Candidatus Parcubacteria bacterium]